MLRIRPEQLKALEKESMDEFQERLVATIRRSAGMLEVKAHLHAQVTQLIKSAIAAGFRTERGAANYVMERICFESENS